MANKKNKIELRDISLSLESEMMNYWNDDPFWDYDDHSGCTCRYCSPWLYKGKDEYEYLQVNKPVWIISRRGSIPHLESVNFDHGGLINLDKVYSKEIMRDRKIDQLLGLGIKKPTIWDFYEERRDI